MSKENPANQMELEKRLARKKYPCPQPLNSNYSSLTCVLFFIVFQAYTSQFLALVMFALMMSEDRLSKQERRKSIIKGLKDLPGKLLNSPKVQVCKSEISFLWLVHDCILICSSGPNCTKCG